MQNRMRLLVGIMVTCFFSYLFFMRTDTQQLVSAIRESNLKDNLGIALLLLITSHIIRVLRWSWLLQPTIPSARFSLCIIPYGSAIAVNNLLPFRAGDIYRVVGFNKQLGSSSGQMLGSMLAERMLDLFVLLLFAAIGLSDKYFGSMEHGIEQTSWFAFSVIGLVGLIALVVTSRIIQSYRHSFLNSANVSGKLHKLIQPVASQFLTVIESLAYPSVCLPAIGLSILAWLISGMVFSLAAENQLQAVPFWASWFSMAAGNLGTLFPGAPGGVGTFHYFAALGLLSYGANWNNAVAAVIIVHAFQWIFTTVLGLVCLCLNVTTQSK